MKYEIKFTTAFKKSWKKMQKRGMNLFLLNVAVMKLANGERLPSQYRDHELVGKFKGFHECHIQPDWLLIYLIDHQLLILTLADTGSHSDLFSLKTIGAA